MQVTDTFKNVINAHLHTVAERDSLFAETLKKANKNINDCITYILNEVKKSGKMGFADEEIFGMAVHYYDEDDIKVGSPVNCKVVINHKVDSLKKMEASIEARKSAPTVKSRKSIEANQFSLFS